MIIKRTVSILLVLVILLGLFAGCGEQGGETQPGTEPQPTQETTQPTQAPTEPEKLDVPRTASDFIDNFNILLEQVGIPVVFSGAREQELDEGGKQRSYFLFSIDGGYQDVSGTFKIRLFYPQSASDPLEALEVVLEPDATEREQELYPQICAAVSTWCDVYMDEKVMAELMAAEPTANTYVAYTGDIGTFWGHDFYIWTEPEWRDYAVSYYQSSELTHSIIRYPDAGVQKYRIDFTEAGERLYIDREVSVLTVQELEYGINAWIASEGLPIECAFQQISPGTWWSYFRFTDFDDPDFGYPTVTLESWMSQTDDMRHAMMNNHLSDSLRLTVSTWGIDTDVPVYQIVISLEDYGYGLPMLQQQFCQGVINIWVEETGDQEVGDFYATACVNAESEQSSELQTEDYFLSYTKDDRYSIRSPAVFRLDRFDRTNILDSELLEFKYTTSEPMVQDGLFNYNQHYTDIFNMSANSVNLQQVSPMSMIKDYLAATGSKIEIEFTSLISLSDYIDSDHYFPDKYMFDLYPFMINESECLDVQYFGFVEMDNIEASESGRGDFYDQGYLVYYNECIESPVDADYVLRAAVGCGVTLDEGMTIEEAIALHKEPMEPAMVFEGWEVYQYCPREVMHILMKEPTTGQVLYYVISPELFETYYGDLEHFVADDTTLELYSWICKL